MFVYLHITCPQNVREMIFSFSQISPCCHLFYRKHKTAKQSDTSGRQSAIYDNIVTSGVPNSNHVYKTIKPPESKAVGPPQPVSQPQPVGPAQTVGPPQPVEASQKKEAAELNSKLTNNNNTKSNEHTYITIIPSEAVKENNIISIRL